jgi:aspartate kinase
MKFGGSSLADYERLDHVARLVVSQITTAGYQPRAIVCSAMGKTTNNLLAAGQAALQRPNQLLTGNEDNDDTDYMQYMTVIRTLHMSVIEQFELPASVAEQVEALLDECTDLLKGVRLIQELSPKSLDQLVSYGERCSVRLMAARLCQVGVSARALDAWNVGLRTDSDFGNAQLKVSDCAADICAAFAALDAGTVAVVTGFIAHDPLGRVTTLGRGGSDLTATALGAALLVDEVQVWKDVDGILTCDPRMVPMAVPVPNVSYEEAAELAYFGAQVLHPIAMQPAMQANVPVRVKNSYNPTAVGTLIRNVKETKSLVTAITYKQNIKLMDIQSTQMLGAYGFLAKVFAEFEKRKLSVDVLASSEVSISLTLDKKQKDDEIQALMDDLKATCAEVKVSDHKSILTLIADVGRSSEVLATVFRVFASQGINVEMMSQGASKVNISFILDGGDLEPAVLALHHCFFEQHQPSGMEAAQKDDALIVEQQ